MRLGDELLADVSAAFANGRTAFRAGHLGWTSLVAMLEPSQCGGQLDMLDLPAGCTPFAHDGSGNLLLLMPDQTIVLYAFCGVPLTGGEPECLTLASDAATFSRGLREPGRVARDDWAYDLTELNIAAGHDDWGHNPPPGYHWHFDVPKGVMQLVSADIHWSFPHTSSTLWQ